MAVVKVIQIKKSLSGAVKYVCNDAKTEVGKLVSTNFHFLNRDVYASTIDAFAELEQQSMNNKRGGRATVKAHHIIQSFAPGEVSAEDAHAIGLEFMSKLTGEDYYYLVATHDDRPHIHNHFLVCPINTSSFRRMRVQKHTLQEWRDMSDDICKRWGLSVIEPQIDEPRYENPHVMTRGTSKKATLRSMIDEAVRVSTDWRSFVDTLSALGVDITTRRQAIMFRDPQNMERWVRGYRLGGAYTESGLMTRLGRSPLREFTCGQNLVHLITSGRAEIHLPGIKPGKRVVINARNLVQHGNSYHFYLSENEKHSLVDRDGAYVGTVGVHELRKIFNQPNIEINMPILASPLNRKRGKSEAQARYYAAIDSRVATLQKEINEHPILRQLNALSPEERITLADKQSSELLVLRERIDDGYSKLQQLIDSRPNTVQPGRKERELVQSIDALTKEALTKRRELALTKQTLDPHKTKKQKMKGQHL